MTCVQWFDFCHLFIVFVNNTRPLVQLWFNLLTSVEKPIRSLSTRPLPWINRNIWIFPAPTLKLAMWQYCCKVFVSHRLDVPYLVPVMIHLDMPLFHVYNRIGEKIFGPFLPLNSIMKKEGLGIISLILLNFYSTWYSVVQFPLQHQLTTPGCPNYELIYTLSTHACAYYVTLFSRQNISLYCFIEPVVAPWTFLQWESTSELNVCNHKEITENWSGALK